VGFANKEETDFSYQNDKIQAIKIVGSFLENYDSDRLIDFYGFSGIVPGTTQTSNYFALNGKMFNPDVCGIDECI